MLKKIDKFILSNFLGPFILTFFVVVFIFLVQLMVGYMQEFIGKDLGFDIFLRLIFFFSLNIVPMALPLSILLASLIAYGNLGEHFELTAIKSSGISLVRTIQPIFFLVCFLVAGSFLFNNYVVPKANLKGYSLLYDIKQTKPALEFKEGLFYNGLPGFSIKVGKKYPDGITLSDIIIYDHTQGLGNTKVIMADSGKMYAVYNDRYLKLELFRGHFYNESGETQSRYDGRELTRTAFNESEILFSLASFDMNKTAEELFTHNRVMKNVSQLGNDVDSMRSISTQIIQTAEKQLAPFYFYMFKPVVFNPQVATYDFWLYGRQENYPMYSSVNIRPPFIHRPFTAKEASGYVEKHLKIHEDTISRTEILSRSTNAARNIRGYLQSYQDRYEHLQREANTFEVEQKRKFTQAVAIFVMFLVGAPLGAIIKKGGLGFPVLISIIFFIIFYVATLLSEKYAKEGLISVEWGIWIANALLLPVGLFFLKQARSDSPLFDADFYIVTVQRILGRIKSSKKSVVP